MDPRLSVHSFCVLPEDKSIQSNTGVQDLEHTEHTSTRSPIIKFTTIFWNSKTCITSSCFCGIKTNHKAPTEKYGLLLYSLPCCHQLNQCIWLHASCRFSYSEQGCVGHQIEFICRVQSESISFLFRYSMQINEGSHVHWGSLSLFFHGHSGLKQSFPTVNTLS